MNRVNMAVGLWVLAVGVALLGWGSAYGEDAAAPADGGGTDWAAFSPRDLADMARAMPGDDAQLKAARLELAAYVTKAYLKDAVAAKTVAVGDWRALAESLGSDLSSADRAAWLDKIVGAYAGNAEAVRGLKADELRDVVGAAKTLGVSWQTRQVLVTRVREAFDAGTVAGMKFEDVGGVCDTLRELGARPSDDLVMTYVDKSSEWRSFEPEKLGALAGRLDGLGGVAAKQQIAVAKHVMATYLGSADTVKGIDLATWGKLTPSGRNLSGKDRKAWTAALKAAFAADEGALLQLSAGSVLGVTGALAPLDSRQSEGMAYTWLTKSDLAKGVTEDELTRLAGTAVVYEGVPRAKREDMLKMLDAFYAAKGADALTYEQYMNVMCCWNVLETVPKVQEWTMRLYQSVLGSEEARQKVTMPVLEALGIWFYHSQMTGSGQDYPALAQALARHAREGTLRSSQPETLGATLGKPETRQILRAELLDSQGQPRPEVARILAWAYRGTPELDGWCTFVDKQVADAKASDAKALWTMVKAHTAPVIPIEPEPRASLRGLKQALGVAESDTVRLVVLEDVVRLYEKYDARVEAVNLLESVKNQFGAEAAGAIGARQEKLRGDDAEFQAAAARRLASDKLAEARVRLEYYRKCLADAGGTAGAEADGLRAAIQQVEKDLNP
jgi:hypothetical protein